MPRLEFVVDPRWGFRSIQGASFCPDADVDRVREQSSPVRMARYEPLVDDLVSRPCWSHEVCDQHARDRVAVHHPVHISCPEANAGRSTVRSTRTSFSPAFGQPLAQDVRVGHLKLGAAADRLGARRNRA